MTTDRRYPAAVGRTVTLRLRAAARNLDFHGNLAQMRGDRWLAGLCARKAAEARRDERAITNRRILAAVEARRNQLARQSLGIHKNTSTRIH